MGAKRNRDFVPRLRRLEIAPCSCSHPFRGGLNFFRAYGACDLFSRAARRWMGREVGWARGRAS